MRVAFFVLAAAMALTACDSGDVPSPTERQQGQVVQAPVAADVVELRAEGLTAGAEAFYFAAGQKEVEAALSKALGPVLRSGENTECGAGAVAYVDHAEGLTVHFQQGRLVGWNWRAPQDGDVVATGTVRLSGTVQIGTPRAEAEAAPGFAKVEGSTLGEEFALGGKVGGFIDGDKISMLYAGIQCFAR